MTSELVARAASIAEQVAAKHADEVDRDARFPIETIAALKEAKLLSAAVPTALGGGDASIAQLAEMCLALGQRCAASGMVLAMHQIQVVCMLRHAQASSFFQGYFRELVAKQSLIASVTSEVGIGGDMRSSQCAVEPHGARIKLDKAASTISYGAHADDLLVTARREPDAPPNDQALVLLKRSDYRLEVTGKWDTLGMRGTCSPSFLLTSTAHPDQIVPASFGDIASATMVPVSHLLWGSVWLGIATDAVNRARAMVRGQARKTPGSVPPTALRLAEAMTLLQTMRQAIHAVTVDYEALIASPDGGAEHLSSIGFALQVNQLKVAVSELAVRIVSQALSICGIAGYRNDTPQSLGRHLRDVHSASLMIGNDRIHATNAALLLVHKGD